MAIVTYLVRVLPLTFIRKEIKNETIRSFLYYVPYVTLAIMTFPDILYQTDSMISALVALMVGIILAWLGGGLMSVSITCCLTVFVIELFI